MSSPTRSSADIPISKVELILLLCSQLLKLASFRGQIHANELLVFLNICGREQKRVKPPLVLLGPWDHADSINERGVGLELASSRAVWL